MSNWIHNRIFYHIYPLGFCGAPQFYEEPVHHRLQLIEEYIPHMKEMQVNALYLGPVFASFEHGYDTSDYQRIDPRLGTNEDFRHLCHALHEADIKIVLDGVFNHVGRSFWAFQDVQAKGSASPYATWFHNLDFNQSSPMQDAFTYSAWEGHYNLVKLNLQNEEVVQYLLDSVGMWMDTFHIDGLRLDAADCIDPAFFKRLKQYTKQKDPNFWLMGEIIHGDYTRWANESMLDSVTNYECYKGLYSSHNTKNYFEIAYSLNRQFGSGGIYKDLNLYSFVDNHDVNRLASLVDEPHQLMNIYTLLYTMPGTPSVYYGSEYAICGTKHDGSDADIRPSLSRIEEMPKNNELYQHICMLGNIRLDHDALQNGQYEQIAIRNEQFIFRRVNEKECVYITLNLSAEDAFIDIDNTCDHFLDLLHACDIQKNESGCIQIPAYGARILIAKEGQQASTTPIKKNMESQQQIIETIPVVTTEDNSGPIKLGRYRHFKGKDYAVLYIAKHSESLEDYVVYRQLYGDGEVWIRPLAMFQETVEHNGNIVPRFAYLGK